MPFYRFNGLLVHIRMDKRQLKKAGPPCEAPLLLNDKLVRCCAFSGFQCDGPGAGGKTCDKHLCKDHATEVGPDKHLCPEHAAQRAKETPELF